MKGKDCIDFIHRMSTNDMRDMQEGKGRTTVFTNERGKIIDVVDVYFVNDNFYIIHSQGTRESLLDLFERYVIMEDISIERSKIFSTVLGLKGASGKKDIYTDDDGKIIMSSPRIYPGGQLFVSDNSINEEIGLVNTGYPVAFNEYNTLRLEQGIPLFKFDFSDQVNPLETNLREFISWTKGCYVGQEVVARLDSYNKIKRFLKGVILNSPPSGLVDFRNLEQTIDISGNVYYNGAIAGTITSIAYSTYLDRLLLMVRFERGKEKTGNEVEFDFYGVRLSGEIVELPFLKGISHE
jgi:tRNA-modifying protein YgfZ